MCIIIVKPKGQEPSKDTLKRCFNYNEDGAGYVYNDGQMNTIRKGFFEFDEFYKSYKENVKIEYPAILHFRIATAGKIDAGNCHPYPLSSRIPILRATFIKTKAICVAHNGILDIEIDKKKISDTAQLIIDILSKDIVKDNLFSNKTIQELIGKYIGRGKMAFINKDGKILMIGDFIKDGGLYFSNDSYKNKWRWMTRCIYPRSFGYYNDDYTTNQVSCEFCGKAHRVHWNKELEVWICETCEEQLEIKEIWDDDFLK